MPRKNSDEADRITAALWEQAAERLDEGLKPLWKQGGYPAVRRRIRWIIEDTEDDAQVELVCLTMEERQQHLFSVESLAWGSFDYVRKNLGWPTDSWKYALWARRLSPSTVVDSAYHWLGQWVDGELAEDPGAIDEARTALENLYRQHTILDESW